MKRLFCVLLILITTSLMACSNTFEGLGRDLQVLGESIEKSSKD